LDALSRSGFNTVVGNDFGWKFKRGICSKCCDFNGNGSFAGKATSMSVIQRKIFEAAIMILSAGKLAHPKSLQDRGRLSFRPLAAAVQAGL
jgi:hypothetical protein